MAKSKVTGFDHFAKQLEKMNAHLEKLEKQDQVDKFYTNLAKNLAARLLRRVIKRTPVRDPDFPTPNSKDGNEKQVSPRGELQKGWTIGKVVKSGGTYSIEVFNSVHYASYVEYGHRGVYVPELGVTLHVDKRWTPGKFMMTISEMEMERITPGILEDKFNKFLRKVFDDK